MNPFFLIRPSTALAAVLALASAGAALAQQASDPAGDIAIVDGAASNGAVTVNAAAGNNNQQINLGVIAAGDAATASGSAVQIMTEAGDGTSRPASAEIAAGAFSNSNGWLAVNVASGSDNQQANMAIMAFGIEGPVATDTMLSQTRASHQPIGDLDETAPPERNVAIGAGAFENSSGLVQVSLVGGERNSSANIFALTVAAGANQ